MADSTSFPPPPTDTIDWSQIGFKIRDVNGHIESHFSKSTGAWSALRFVRSPHLSLHGMCPALNYGQQAYEGLKAFRTPADRPGGQQIRIFRPDRNARRLAGSAAVVSIPPVPEAVFLAAVRAAVALNASFVPPHETGAFLYIRPLVFGSSGQLGLFPPEEYTFCVFVAPTGVFHGADPVRALVLDEFDRAAPNGVGHAKVGGNYAPVLRWSDAARARGFGITLHMDSATHREIDEFSTSGFVAVSDGDGAGPPTLVVPDSKCVIDSVTSVTAQDLARSYGWNVEKRPISYGELPTFTEVMAAGTAAALVPIRSITRRISAAVAAGVQPLSAASSSVGHERVSVSGNEETVAYLPDSQLEAGPLCLRLRASMAAIQLGLVEDEFGWCVTVTEEDTQHISVME